MDIDSAPQPEYLHEKIAAQKILSRTASIACKTSGSFSGWVLVGTGAVVGTVLANLNEVVNHIGAGRVKSALFLLTWAAAFAIVARYMAATVYASVEGSRRAEQIGAKLGNSNARFGVFLREYRRGQLWPASWMFDLSVAKAVEGDLTFSGRLVTWIAFAHGIFVLVQLALTLCSLATLARGL